MNNLTVHLFAYVTVVLYIEVKDINQYCSCITDPGPGGSTSDHILLTGPTYLSLPFACRGCMEVNEDNILIGISHCLDGSNPT